MVAIQVLPLDPDSWREVEDDHEQPAHQRVHQGPWRPLPDRPTRIRRRRLAVLVLAVAAVAGTVALVDVVVGRPAQDLPRIETDARTPAPPITEEVYVVQPGDTLWSIAERLAPGADPRPIVAELREITGGVALDVGDRVPVHEL